MTSPSPIDPSTYFRKGFGLKSEVKDELAADYDGRIVDYLRSHDFTLVSGDVNGDMNPNFASEAEVPMHHWRVVLTRKAHGKRRTLSSYFSQGIAHTKPPQAYEVLGCLISDGSGTDQPFEEWASDLGYDTDSRQAERTYKACADAGRRVRAFLGADFDRFAPLGVQRFFQRTHSRSLRLLARPRFPGVPAELFHVGVKHRRDEKRQKLGDHQTAHHRQSHGAARLPARA
jgi:hypothetical protein